MHKIKAGLRVLHLPGSPQGRKKLETFPDFSSRPLDCVKNLAYCHHCYPKIVFLLVIAPTITSIDNPHPAQQHLTCARENAAFLKQQINAQPEGNLSCDYGPRVTLRIVYSLLAKRLDSIIDGCSELVYSLSVLPGANKKALNRYNGSCHNYIVSAYSLRSKAGCTKSTGARWQA
eukprot:6193902-Pleurochrysis_carterae.AAC.1